MPESGIFSRRFDFGEIFNLTDLKNEIKFTLINKSKNIEYTGVLDEFGRTPRIFSDTSDNVEIKFINENQQNGLLVVSELNEEDYNFDVGDLVDDQAQQYSEGNDEEYVDDLEDDFKKFGV